MRFRYVEVPNGAAGMLLAEKRRLISTVARRFTVMAEVESKDPAAPFSPEKRAKRCSGDVEARPTWVITERRAQAVPWRVLGSSVSRPRAECRQRVLRLA
jgi:phosphosulfolactate synthase (CoM biosynthesis protein A)